eukprot:1796324-Pyramimonas_sp.AAC.1
MAMILRLVCLRIWQARPPRADSEGADPHLDQRSARRGAASPRLASGGDARTDHSRASAGSGCLLQPDHSVGLGLYQPAAY